MMGFLSMFKKGGSRVGRTALTASPMIGNIFLPYKLSFGVKKSCRESQ
jgi:hypothetical protein